MKSLHTPLTEKLGIDHAVIQAGMAGGPTTPALVAAVSEAGGLGTLGAGYMTPEQIREAIREIRKLTTRPFAINLFVEDRYSITPEEVANAQQILQPIRDTLGIPTPEITRYSESFDDQLAVILEERVPVFSFTFGIPPQAAMQALKNAGIITVGTATCVQEAIVLEESGVDCIVGQGSEAGGHRGTFQSTSELPLIGTMALIPQIVDRVSIPVIASGGIMDGRGIVAALALGAQGVQLGSAFLTATESGTNVPHRKAVLNSRDDSTVVTRVISGRYARGVKNEFIRALSPQEAQIPPYPVQNALTRDIRSASTKQGNPEYFSLWAGQAAGMAISKGAGEIVKDLVEQTNQVLNRL